MDETKLRSWLIRLYVATTAIILAAVFTFVTLLSLREAQQRDKENFFVLFTAIAEKLQTEYTLRHSFLREYEQNYRLYINIADSGEDSQYNSEDDATHLALFERTTELAYNEGIDITAIPLTGQRRTSSVHPFRYNGSPYYGAASVIPMKESFRTLIVVQSVDTRWQVWKYATYAFGYLVSVLLLSLVGIKLIDRALRPAVESRRRQTEFIAAASHELRTPLTVIQANTATIASMPERTVAAVETIANECSRMARLISDMLLLASADAKSWPVTLAPMEIDTMLLNAYEAYLPVCAKRGFHLELKLPETPLPRIKGDAERLSQVLGILLDNALDYGENADNKTIGLSTYADKNKLIIDVIDHGIGISDDQKQQIFERFYRGDRARNAKRHFGLGLAIAKELIALHEGEITVLDTSGEGSTFRIAISPVFPD